MGRDDSADGLLREVARNCYTETAILRRADAIISTSPNYIPDSKPLQRHIDKVRIAQNGIISERFYPLLGDEEKVKVTTSELPSISRTTRSGSPESSSA